MSRRIAPELVRRGRRLVASLFRPETGREVEDELDFHLAMRMREYVERGMGEEEARRRALEGFGDLDQLRARCTRLADEREGRMRRSAWLDGVRQDLGFALRQLRRSPGFAAVAVGTLALAMGANAAVFSVVHGVLLKPLPYDEPEELVSIWTRYLPTTGLDIPQAPLSAPELLDYRGSSDAIQAVAAWSMGRATLGESGSDPVSIRRLGAGRGLAAVLGVEPALGRLFAPAEEEPGAAPALVLAHDFWTDRFGADPSAIGRTVEVDGESARIVGVLPEGVNFPDERVDVWSPLGLDEQDPGERAGHWLGGIGRLADGLDLSAAEAELETITAGWNRQWEHHSSGHFLFLRPLREDLVGEVRPLLLALLGAVALVLLIACGNVANLFLVRSEGREREMAVRVALGAGRGRLLRQLLTEAFVISLLGAALGVALARWATPLLLAVDPTAIPRSEEVSVSLEVLALTGALVLAVTLLFGSVPALRVGGREGPAGSLRTGRDAARHPGRRLQKTLVGMEVALGLVVIVAAGLVARSFWSLRTVDPGIGVEGVVAFDLDLPPGRYADVDEVRHFYDELARRLTALPTVTAAGSVSVLPTTGVSMRWDFQPADEPAPAEGVPAWNAQFRAVQPAYFEAADLPSTDGRTLGPADDASAPLVAVVDEATVRRFWPGESPLGKRITFQFPADDAAERSWFTIVGVVGDVRDELDEPPLPHVYVPLAQLGPAGMGGIGRFMSMVVRTAGEPATLLPAVRRVMAGMDPELPVSRLRTMPETLDGAVARERLTANLFAAFGLAALLLATIGVYGVVSYAVARRTREMGVRMALGAGRGRVLRMAVAEGAVPALVGATLGLAVALVAAPLVSDLLFSVSPRDAATFVAGPVVLLAVAVMAAWIPAVRATRIDPSRALREE